jgi:murein DD-endopeptidase MepM/ murein hydrolase activator NlpD
MHQGVDFGVPVGTPVMAAGDGTVEAARWALGYGRWVRLRHADGYETAYAHLSDFAPGLAAGQAVRQGQVIGWSGNSGLSTGPHLHFEVWLNGRAIDPATAAPASAPSPSRLAAVMERRRLLERALGENLTVAGP